MIRAYLVICPMDCDGGPELSTVTYTGTYEDVADQIVAHVDDICDRGVDGMALEAWLVTGEVGTVHIVVDEDGERQVCTVVRLAVRS